MKHSILTQRLDLLGDNGISAFSTRMLKSYFPGEPDISFKKSLERGIAQGVIERVCRGAYVYCRAFRTQVYKLELIAVALRAGEYSYISLESALSEYGVISQIPINHLTIMTTGRNQTFRTPYGTIEFTHTERKETEIVERTIRAPERPLRMACVEVALEDLKRVKRNTHMLDMSIYEEVVGEKNITF